MSTRRGALDSSHIHLCVVCDAQIPCESPEDSQHCTVTALICGDCDDFPQSLPRTGSGVHDPEDDFGFESKDSDANDVSQDQDTADSFEATLQDNGHRIEDYDAIDFFESMLQGNDHSDEEWFPEAQTKPENPSTSPARKGGWKKKGRGKR